MNYGQNVAGQWPASITICEVGPRDGLQNEKVHFTVEQKVEQKSLKLARLFTLRQFPRWRILMRLQSEYSDWRGWNTGLW
jgi:hypothetical protein